MIAAPTVAELGASAEETARVLNATVPALRDGAMKIRSCQPVRLEVRDDVSLEVALICESNGASERRFARIRPGVRTEEPDRGPWTGTHAGFEATISPGDPGLPRFAELWPNAAGGQSGGSELLAHRFGRRAAWRATPDNGPPIVAKHYARGSVRRRAALYPRPTGHADMFRTPEVFATDSESRTLQLEFLPGAPLSTVRHRLSEREWERLGVKVRRIAELPGPSEAESWDLAREFETILSFVRRLTRVRPGLAARILEATSREERRPLASGRDVLVHRDLHDGQILVDEDRLALVDWDLAALGPEELDVANLAAHLRLRAEQGTLPADLAQKARGALLRGWFDAHPSGSASSVTQWERLVLLRLAGVYGLRPSDPTLPDRLLTSLTSPELIQ